jgi:hypothetical protein
VITARIRKMKKRIWRCRRAGGDAAETEHAGDDRDDEEDHGVMQHGIPCRANTR